MNEKSGNKREELAEIDEEALCADGYDDAIVGYFERPGQPLVVVYDYDKCVSILMNRDGMTEEEAVEFMDFNTVGAWVGERTPAFLHRLVGDEQTVLS